MQQLCPPLTSCYCGEKVKRCEHGVCEFVLPKISLYVPRGRSYGHILRSLGGSLPHTRLCAQAVAAATVCAAEAAGYAWDEESGMHYSEAVGEYYDCSRGAAYEARTAVDEDHDSGVEHGTSRGEGGGDTGEAEGAPVHEELKQGGAGIEAVPGAAYVCVYQEKRFAAAAAAVEAKANKREQAAQQLQLQALGREDEVPAARRGAVGDAVGTTVPHKRRRCTAVAATPSASATRRQALEAGLRACGLSLRADSRLCMQHVAHGEPPLPRVLVCTQPSARTEETRACTSHSTAGHSLQLRACSRYRAWRACFQPGCLGN